MRGLVFRYLPLTCQGAAPNMTKLYFVSDDFALLCSPPFGLPPLDFDHAKCWTGKRNEAISAGEPWLARHQSFHFLLSEPVHTVYNAVVEAMWRHWSKVCIAVLYAFVTWQCWQRHAMIWHCCLCPAVHSSWLDRPCYHNISWTAWAISMKLTRNNPLAPTDELVRFWRSKVKGQGRSRPSKESASVLGFRNLFSS